LLCAHDDELVPQKETKELKKVIETPQRNRAHNRRFEAEKGERERERERCQDSVDPPWIAMLQNLLSFGEHQLQCSWTLEFFLHAAAGSYAPDQKRRKGRQVEGALVSTAAVFYAPDKQKDKMHQKTSGPWLSGVNKFFNAERKKEKSFKISLD
jgi:hypothetical protein